MAHGPNPRVGVVHWGTTAPSELVLPLTDGVAAAPSSSSTPTALRATVGGAADRCERPPPDTCPDLVDIGVRYASGSTREHSPVAAQRHRVPGASDPRDFIGSRHGPVHRGERSECRPPRPQQRSPSSSRPVSRFESKSARHSCGRSTAWTRRSPIGYSSRETDQPVDDRPRMKALILTALPGEYAAVADHLKFDGVTHISEIRFERGTFEGENITWELYAAEIGMGNVTASIVLTAADYQLHPDLVLFVGVAGSVKPKDLCRGDVVVPERVYQLGGGKEVFKEAEGSVLLARPISFEAQVAIVQLARSIARADWMAEQTQVRPDIEARNAQGSAPRAVIRPVAAGERVLADDQSDLVRGLRDHFNDVVAVDMESRGIYEAAKYQRTPALSIRGISDHLGDKAPETDEEWHPIAASHAASFAFALLRRAGTQDIAGRDRPPQEEPPTETGAIPLREALFSLPPNVAVVVHSWATRGGTAGRDQLVADLNEQREDPAGWLERLTSRELPLSLRSPESTPLLFMVADVRRGPRAQFSGLVLRERWQNARVMPMSPRLLLGRAAWAARRHEATEHSDQLLLRAREAQPEAESLWRFYDLAFENEPSAVLDSSLSIAEALGLRLPQIRGRGRGTRPPPRSTFANSGKRSAPNS